MGEALNDWLNLLQAPAEPPFAEKTTFPDGWRYLLRLILLVLIMIVAVLAFSYIGQNAKEGENLFASFLKNAALQTRYSILVILAGALFAALYSFTMAPLFKITINIRQAFFTVLFMILPWIPIALLVWAFVYILPLATIPFVSLFIVLFLFLIFPIVSVVQFSRGVTLVSGCPKMKCTASVAIPSVIIYLLVLWIWMRMPDAPPPI